MHVAFFKNKLTNIDSHVPQYPVFCSKLTNGLVAGVATVSCPPKVPLTALAKECVEI